MKAQEWLLFTVKLDTSILEVVAQHVKWTTRSGIVYVQNDESWDGRI
jgi:hypothetical protein